MYATLTKFWSARTTNVFLLSMLTTLCLGQQITRYELPIDNNEYYDVMPSQEDGIYLYRHLHSTAVDQVELIKLDTAFQVKWKGYVSIGKQLQLVAQRAVGGFFYLLFRSTEVMQSKLQLYVVSQADGNHVAFTVENFIAPSPTEFHITENAALIAGYYNEAPFVLYFSFATRRSKIVPGLPAGHGELMQVNTFPDGSFDILVKARNFKKQDTMWSQTYNVNGDLQSTFSLNPEDKKHLMTGMAMKAQDNKYIVSGVYGGRNSEFSRGLFFASVDPAGAQQLRYFSYGGLKNFFPGKATSESGVKENAEQQVKEKGDSFESRFLVREIVPYKDQCIVLGEAFSKYSNYFGYRLTHTVVMAFNTNGELMWDKSFEINIPRSYRSDQLVNLDVKDDGIALVYILENELNTKIIRGTEVIEGKKALFADDSDISNKSKTALSNLAPWYKNYFYVTGVQEASGSESRAQRTFFIRLKMPD
jgi:hypothetical protein